MALDSARILGLSTAIVRTYDPSLRVVGVASQSPDGERVELLVRVAGCHPPDECLLMLNVGRATETTLAAELPRAMRSALDRHRVAAADRHVGPQDVP
jgi:hypothetical protein